ncbi:ATP-dependent Clp protease proteolytic subunit [Brucella endophytica]|nr:ATP-dependent Clp protease proteolytic subunit [Brucella endophytica]
MKKIFVPIVALASVLAHTALADVRYVLPHDNSKLSGQDVNVQFWGAINAAKIVDLETVIDKINLEYPEVHAINLYINSGGGDMDSGWVGYTAIKSSKIPIRAINVAKTDSAATLLFCGASQRYVMEGASFLLHPAAISLSSFDYKPDMLDRKVEYLKNLNKYFFKAYRGCTNLKEEDIRKMLSAEESSRSADDTEAIRIGLASKILTAEFPGGASAYILDPARG